MQVLDGRRLLICDNIRRYGLLINEAVHALHMPEATPNAVIKEMSRMQAAGFVRRDQTRGLTYYVLGRNGLAEFEETRAARPYGLQALVSRVGVLGFCLQAGVTKYSFEEFEQYFPGFHRRGHKHCYFLDATGEKPRLGYIHVDHGSPPRRVVAKLLKASRIRSEIAPFNQLIRAGGFLVAAAVPSAGKKVAVERELEEERYGPVAYRVEVVPDLFPLLLTRPTKKGD